MVRQELTNLEVLWPELFPAEQRRVLELLIERVTVHAERVEIAFKSNNVTQLLRDMPTKQITEVA